MEENLGLIAIIMLVSIMLTIWVTGYILEHQIKSLKNEMNMKDVVKYINENNVYVRDELGNILKHHAHIASFNLNDSQKIIIDIDEK